MAAHNESLYKCSFWSFHPFKTSSKNFSYSLLTKKSQKGAFASSPKNHGLTPFKKSNQQAHPSKNQHIVLSGKWCQYWVREGVGGSFSRILYLSGQSIERFHTRGQRLCKFIRTKESVYIRKEFNSHRTGLVHQQGCRFIVLEHQYGRRDVM